MVRAERSGGDVNPHLVTDDTCRAPAVRLPCACRAPAVRLPCACRAPAVRLPCDAPIAAYQEQATQLLAGHRAHAPEALRIFHECLPRFLDPVVTWKLLAVSEDEIRAAALTPDDARLAVARGYSFRDWSALTAHVSDVTTPGSPVQEFETAVEAVITGDSAALRAMLTTNAGLVHARSTRVTCHDPAVHGATLLHYLGANGIEGHRQRSPASAVQIAKILLDGGAAVDALAGMYGGEYATLSMLISSSPPAEAGVQIPLVNTLLDYGAAINGTSSPTWHSPVLTALLFGFRDAAEAVTARSGNLALVQLLVARGAQLDIHDTLWNTTLLGWARYAGHEPVAAYLAQHGATDD